MNQSNAITLRTGEEIPLSAIEFSTSRSGGPGGQHANKVETRVEAKLNLLERPELQEKTRELLLERLEKKLDKEGYLHVSSSTSRSQHGNKAETIRKLESLLDAALKPRKKRIPTKPSRAAKRRRLEEKRQQSEKKSRRRWKPDS